MIWTKDVAPEGPRTREENAYIRVVEEASMAGALNEREARSGGTQGQVKAAQVAWDREGTWSHSPSKSHLEVSVE